MMRRAVISAVIGFIMLAIGIGVTVSLTSCYHVHLHASSPAEREILNRCSDAVILDCSVFFTRALIIVNLAYL